MKSFSLFYKEVDGNEKQKCNYTTRLDTFTYSGRSIVFNRMQVDKIEK